MFLAIALAALLAAGGFGIIMLLCFGTRHPPED